VLHAIVTNATYTFMKENVLLQTNFGTEIAVIETSGFTIKMICPISIVRIAK
jgi:hypothetical protein